MIKNETYVSMFGAGELLHQTPNGPVIMTAELRASLAPEGPVMISPNVLSDIGLVAGLSTMYVEQIDREFFDDIGNDHRPIGVGFSLDIAQAVGCFYVSPAQILEIAAGIAVKRSSSDRPVTALNPKVLSFVLKNGFEDAFINTRWPVAHDSIFDRRLFRDS